MKIIMGVLVVLTTMGFDGGSREERQIRKSIRTLFDTDGYTLTLMTPGNSASGREQEKGAWYSIRKNNSLLGYLYRGRVNTCRAGGCRNPGPGPANQESEYFLYYTIVDTALIIRQIRILDYRATHGYEITARSWLKQFNGYQGQRVFIPGKNIDGISGATVSVTAIVKEIPFRYNELKRLLNTSPDTFPEQ